MLIPLALGTVVALVIAPRRQFWYLLSAAFVSGALAAVAPQFYWYFVPMYLVALLLWAMRVESPTLTGYATLVAAGLLVWLSDNTIINAAFSEFMRALADLLVALFGSIASAIGVTIYAALAGAALAWSWAGRRIIKISHETPLAIAAAYYLAYVLLITVVRAAAEVASMTDMGAIASQAISMTIVLIGLYRLNEAFKGEVEAAVDAAVALPFVSAAFPEFASTIVPIAALLAILDIAWAAVEKRYAAAAVALALGLAGVHA